jgi:hypothetical protein
VNTGVHHASGPNPFSRGPGGGGGLVLSAHDIGASYRTYCCITLTIVTVPIYDARKITNVDFYELVLDVDKLPRVNREIPAGSCVVVADTLNMWGRDSPINISFNIKWAMLLGVPSRSG